MRRFETAGRFAVTGTLALVCACGGGAAATTGPQHADIPIYPGVVPAKSATSAAEQPPPPSASKPSPFPAIHRATLPNGLRVAVIEAHALPIVQVRVLVHAGMGYGQAGAAEITAEMLKDGGAGPMTPQQVVSRIESLGASLSVDVDFDRSVLGLGVTKSHLADAMAILGPVLQAPRFDAGELKKLLSRRTDEAEEAERSNGQWMALRLMFRELYSAKNPYATYDLLPSEIAKINGGTVRSFHKRFYVPKNTEIIFAGDVDLPTAQAEVVKALGSWKGGEPPKVSFPAAIAPAKRRVIVASRPKSAQSDIFVANLAPPRDTPDWPALRVASQILGGGVASRLFADVREQRSLAYSTYARILPLAHGEEPVFAYAGTQTDKTVASVSGILENMDRITHQPVTAAEVNTAGRYLSDIFAVALETVGAIAEQVAVQDTLGLPDGYWDQYRAAVRSLDVAKASAAAKVLFPTSASLIIVAGDADVIAKPLSRFGEVVVVDPEKEFATVSTIPQSASAPAAPTH